MITITGLFLPTDITGSILVLGYNPMEMCFFGTGSGVESAMEIELAEGQKQKLSRLRIDNIIEIIGQLRLNAGDIMRLFYSLEEAELIKINEQGQHILRQKVILQGIGD